jgi:hypothetical protein
LDIGVAWVCLIIHAPMPVVTGSLSFNISSGKLANVPLVKFVAA